METSIERSPINRAERLSGDSEERRGHSGSLFDQICFMVGDNPLDHHVDLKELINRDNAGARYQFATRSERR